MNRNTPRYTLLFSLFIALIASILVSSTSYFLHDRIAYNEKLDVDKSYNAVTNRSGEIKTISKNLKQIQDRYAVPFSGDGVWGKIFGILGLENDRKTITGIIFYKHSETPGLGSRIESHEYRDQFVGKRIDQENFIDEIDGITGATLTSNAVKKILNDVKEELDD